MKGPLVLLLFISGMGIHAQVPVKKIFDNRDTMYGFYTLIVPESKKANALLVLLDGYGGDAVNFLQETAIDEKAFQNNILTVCIPTGQRIYADTAVIHLMDKILKEVITTYGIAEDHVVMGGFSSGGTILLRYAELCMADNTAHPVTPRAVFTGDSPVDLAGLYRSSKRELEKNFPGWWLNESRMIIQTLYKDCGDPVENKAAWGKINPFNASDTAAGNERFLTNISFRSYHDIDAVWQLQNRGRSLYQVNALDASELVSRLRMRGNQKAEFIQSKIPGQRANGQRHPHSWNIIDADELMEWIRSVLK